MFKMNISCFKVRSPQNRHFYVSRDILIYRFIALKIKCDLKGTSIPSSGRKFCYYPIQEKTKQNKPETKLKGLKKCIRTYHR